MAVINSNTLVKCWTESPSPIHTVTHMLSSAAAEGYLSSHNSYYMHRPMNAIQWAASALRYTWLYLYKHTHYKQSQKQPQTFVFCTLM